MREKEKRKNKKEKAEDMRKKIRKRGNSERSIETEKDEV